MVNFIVISTLCMLYLMLGFLLTYVKAYDYKQKGGRIKAIPFIGNILTLAFFNTYRFKENDIVVNKWNITDRPFKFNKPSFEAIPAGTKGVIVHIYDNKRAGEVEFFKDGVTMGVVTVNFDDLRFDS